MKALILAALLAAPAAALRLVAPPAPEFPTGGVWLNARPMTLQLLLGRKVTLVAFINPTSINSIRTFPALKTWFDQYGLTQLMIVGVVTPDIEVQRDPLWVHAQLTRFGIDFPVLIDADRRLWKEYANEGWPALYLVDRKGRIVFDRLGEGGYAEIERELREALADLIGENALPAPAETPEPPSRGCGRAMSDIPLGARAKAAPVAIGKTPRRRDVIGDSRLRETAVQGRWNPEPDGLRLAQAPRDQDCRLRVVYKAAQALAVLAPPPSGKARFFVKQDDLWLHEGNAGADVRFDDDGRSYVAVDGPRLYDLTRDAGERPHELSVLPEKKGSAVYSFSFSDICLVTRLP